MQVLIVDDQAYQRVLLRQVIGELDASVTVADFADPIEALQWSREVVPDLVILDYRMPKMDGLEFARRFRRPATHRDVQMMLVTGVPDEPLRQAALDAGITDFLLKPFAHGELSARCRNMLQARQRQRASDSRTTQLETQLRSSAQEMERRELGLLGLLVRAYCEREGANVELPYRVSRIAGLIAESSGWPAAAVREIEQIAWLRDVGNVALPEGILTKPGALSATERGMMRKHTVLGYQLLKDSPSAVLRKAAAVALHHHECWDGTGYPDGLAGPAIPKAARLVAVADVLNALTVGRPYRAAWSIERAIAFVKDGAGVLFDPGLVAAVAEREDDFVRLLAEGQEAWGRSPTPMQWTGAALSGYAGR